MANESNGNQFENQESVLHVENKLLQEIIAARTPEATEAAVSYAEFLRARGLNAENYPVFLKMLTTDNRWVLDALLGASDPFQLFSSIPPNRYLLHKCFNLLDRWQRGGIEPRTLAVALGVLERSYSEPRAGFQLHPVTIADVNNLGKHLDEDQPQSYSQNRVLLDVLDDLGKLRGSRLGGDVDAVARQAMKIRSHFLDSTRSLAGCLPIALLATGHHAPAPLPPRHVFVG